MGWYLRLEFFKGNICILIQMLSKFIPGNAIDNESILVQVWQRIGNESSSEPRWPRFIMPYDNIWHKVKCDLCPNNFTIYFKYFPLSCSLNVALSMGHIRTDIMNPYWTYVGFDVSHSETVAKFLFCCNASINCTCIIIPPVGSGTPAFRLGSRIDPHRHRGVVKVHWRVPWVGGLFSWVVATFTL